MSLKVVQMPLASLAEFSGNAKIHDEANVEAIRASIRRFGNCDPIGVWTTPDGTVEIVEGHGRKMALEAEGYEVADVIFLDHLTDEERRAYALAHNQTTMMSDFDLEILEAELDALADFDMGDFGFDVADEDKPVEVVEDEVPEDAPSLCKIGDVWQLGRHRLMCGSSADGEHMSILFAGGGVKPVMVFTDPPYGVAIGDKNKMLDECAQKAGRITENIIGDTLSTDELYDMLLKAFSNLREACAENCSYYVSSPQGGDIGLMMMMMMRDAGLPVRHNLIWAKNSATFSMGRLDYDYKHEPIFYTWTKRHDFYGSNDNTLLEFDKPRKCDLHPTMKPVALVAHLMENSSRKGDVVADIFGGSGTTLVVAEQLGRTCYMMELDPHYCDVIIERWQNLTGGTAVRANG